MLTQFTHDMAMMSRRRWLAATAGLVLGLAAFTPAKAQETIKVGVLHSLSGTMAISETTLKDTVLFLIDALTPAHAFDPAIMPNLAALAQRGASGHVHTGPVTTTAPCIFSLMTGRPGSLVQAIFNFDAADGITSPDPARPADHVADEKDAHVVP